MQTLVNIIGSARLFAYGVKCGVVKARLKTQGFPMVFGSKGLTSKGKPYQLYINSDYHSLLSGGRETSGFMVVRTTENVYQVITSLDSSHPAFNFFVRHELAHIDFDHFENVPGLTYNLDKEIEADTEAFNNSSDEEVLCAIQHMEDKLNQYGEWALKDSIIRIKALKSLVAKRRNHTL